MAVAGNKEGATDQKPYGFHFISEKFLISLVDYTSLPLDKLR
jgi:hypothetical protein